MKINDAISFFGSKKKLAEALGITRGAVTQWSYWGDDVPIQRAYQIEVLSNGQLKASVDCKV